MKEYSIYNIYSQFKKKSEINVHVPITQLKKNITTIFEDPYVPFSKLSSPEG